MRRLIAAVVLVFASALLGAAPASAGDTRCFGTITGLIVDNVVVPSGAECLIAGGHLLANLVAEPGATLTVGGTGIAGNVHAKEGARFHAVASAIGGNYACDKCQGTIFGTGVFGNVDIKEAQNGTFVEFSRIDGNLDVVGGSAGSSAFLIAFTQVGGNVKFEKNAGPTSIFRNTIAGNLSIAENNVSGAFCPGPGQGGFERPCIENGQFFNAQVGGHMEVKKNVGPSDVSLNFVEGKLHCKENSPAPAGSGNTARKKEGQCRTL